MSLKSNVTAWLGDYDNSNQTGPNATASIGSILTVANDYHTGGAGEPNSIYVPNSSLPYEIYDFKVYAGQGLDSVGAGAFGSKFVLESTNGFSWDTVNAGGGKYSFETSGSLNTLKLGYAADGGYSPAQATLTAFDTAEPLLVVNNFNVVVDYVALNTFGVADGNAQITVNAGNQNLFSYPQYYDKVTLNSAIIYDLTFDEAAAATSTFEYVLDAYLSGFSGGAITSASDISVINSYLSANGSSVSFDYYATAPSSLSSVEASTAFAEVESDLLLAA
ncbi:hypothetical protein B5M06_15040 [Comamonas kerstersii]|uniref:Uncharacterized protein n=1 Tax=Comamonas kerstersii TaxID=225992 RepID=A0A1V0BHK2_9BURK|nr:hypothetical protein [Comamonas kerstersii]AQZ99371.1 hypothetical protein B5M06_15040 [Comamonas kerstersii]